MVGTSRLGLCLKFVEEIQLVSALGSIGTDGRREDGGEKGIVGSEAIASIQVGETGRDCGKCEWERCIEKARSAEEEGANGGVR